MIKTKLIKTILVVLSIFLTSTFVLANENYFEKNNENDDNEKDLTTNTVNTDLFINIKKPKESLLYIYDKELLSLPLGLTFIFGKLTVEIEAYENGSGIDRVEIYLDDKLQANLIGPYYEYMIDDKLFFKHSLKAIAYDKSGNSASDEIDLFILNNGKLPDAPIQSDVGIATQANTDGFNYYNYKDGVGDFVYNQLWYFNFLDDNGTQDPNDDIAGVAAFGLANPENLFTGGGLVDSFGMIIRDPSLGDSFSIFSEDWDPTIPENFQVSETFEPGPGFELAIPTGNIDVVSPDHYHITGDVVKEDREIKWDLHYRRSLGEPWLPWVKWPVPNTLGIIPAWINYHMQMANADVSGTFYVKDGSDEITYELENVRGYHDGFYSEFVFSIVEWNWLDFKQDNLSVHLLYPHAPVYSCEDGWETCTPGNLRIVYNDSSEEKEYNFYRGCDRDKNEIFITYDETAIDERYPNVEYPTEETIHAIDDEGNRLELHWSLIRYMIVYFDVPDPFYDTVTFEIIASFTGTFYEASTGDIIPISGPGWSDWSGKAFPEE